MAASGHQQVTHLLWDEGAVGDVVGQGLVGRAGERLVGGLAWVEVEEPATGGDRVVMPTAGLQVLDRQTLDSEDAAGVTDADVRSGGDKIAVLEGRHLFLPLAEDRPGVLTSLHFAAREVGCVGRVAGDAGGVDIGFVLGEGED